MPTRYAGRLSVRLTRTSAGGCGHRRRGRGPVDLGRELDHGRRVEDRAQRQRHAELVRTRDITCIASSECPPSAKKLSWMPISSDRQHARSRSSAIRALGLGPRRYELLRGRARRSHSGSGSASRSTLPFGVQRQLARRARTRSGSCSSGTCSARKARRSLGVGRGVRRRRGRRRAGSRRARRGGRRRPPRGCSGRRSSTVSISPGSIRKPRILIWRSVRPRKSIVPSGSQRARSPVR